MLRAASAQRNVLAPDRGQVFQAIPVPPQASVLAAGVAQSGEAQGYLALVRFHIIARLIERVVHKFLCEINFRFAQANEIDADPGNSRNPRPGLRTASRECRAYREKHRTRQASRKMFDLLHLAMSKMMGYLVNGHRSMTSSAGASILTLPK
jgi:hypothetical protein